MPEPNPLRGVLLAKSDVDARTVAARKVTKISKAEMPAAIEAEVARQMAPIVEAIAAAKRALQAEEVRTARQAEIRKLAEQVLDVDERICIQEARLYGTPERISIRKAFPDLSLAQQIAKLGERGSNSRWRGVL
jgi:VIT1/CCC1 family predicted Fe2+/Mn2+ transporter